MGQVKIRSHTITDRIVAKCARVTTTAIISRMLFTWLTYSVVKQALSWSSLYCCLLKPCNGFIWIDIGAELVIAMASSYVEDFLCYHSWRDLGIGDLGNVACCNTL